MNIDEGKGGLNMGISGGFIEAIGNTPLVRLRQLSADFGIELYAKMELLNPGGSAKDRPALRMIGEALKAGDIGPGTTVIESSSGNLAISLAMLCRCLGLRLICVIDSKTTEANRRILQAAGAELELVDRPDPESGEFLPARLRRVRQLLADIPGSFWPNQYANANNYMAHYDTTMPEIVRQLGQVDYLFGSVSTCGTIRGCAAYVRDHRLSTQVIAVDAEGSIIFGGSGGIRRFPGLGAGIVPPLRDMRLIDRVVPVADADMVDGCRLLMRREAIMAGASSGANIAAVRRLAPQLGPSAVCVVILHDRGERYLDTVYSDEWVRDQFGATAEVDALPDGMPAGPTASGEA